MRKSLVVSILCLGFFGGQLAVADDALMKEILPSEAESAWAKVDWMTDLWEARREAARSGKPIYLWEMDGHPLGCV